MGVQAALRQDFPETLGPARARAFAYLEHAFRRATDVIDGLDRAQPVSAALRKLGRPEVVQIGCGVGDVLGNLRPMLDARGIRPRLTGFDLNPDVVRVAVDAWEGIVFHCSEFLNARTKPDLTLLIDFLDRLDDPLGYLRALRRKGGAFVFRIPLDDSVYRAAVERIESLRDDVRRANRFTRQSAVSLLDAAGFRLLHEHFTRDVDPPRQGESLAARMQEVPRLVLSTIHPGLCARLIGGHSLVVVASSS